MTQDKSFVAQSSNQYPNFYKHLQNRRPGSLGYQQFFMEPTFGTHQARQLSDDDLLEDGQIYQAVYGDENSQINMVLHVLGMIQQDSKQQSTATSAKISEPEKKKTCKIVKEKRKALSKIASCIALNTIKQVQKKERKLGSHRQKIHLQQNDKEYNFLQKARSTKISINSRDQEPALTLKTNGTRCLAELRLPQRNRTLNKSKKV